MKKITPLIALLLFSIISRAQIPNAGFENLNSNGSIQNWGALIMLAIVLDTNGNPTDSLVLDNQFYFSSNDAHTGTKALEMRNAYWYVSGQKIGGRANLCSNDTNYMGFNPPVSFNQNPVNFSFYYKFFPSGNDTAYAYMRLTDSSFNIVGEAQRDIYGLQSSYQLATVPVIYTSTVTAAFIEMGFCTARPYSQPNYGTRFLVDDVGLSMPVITGFSPVSEKDEELSAFPNPAEKEINLRLKKPDVSQKTYIKIIDSSGKQTGDGSYVISGDLVKINTESLPQGFYFINVIHGNYTYYSRFVK